MRKFAFFIIICNLLSFVFFSCEKENDDHEPPKINVDNTSFSDGDTFYISNGMVNIFQADMFDNEALSSMKVKVRYVGAATDTFEYKKNIAGEDSIVSVALIHKTYVFGLQNGKSIVVNDSFQLPDKYRHRPSGYYIAQDFPVKAGKWYDIVLGCIDRAGNYDSIVYKNITILYKDSIHE